MILHDLLCKKDHRFEGWFKSGDAFAQQMKAHEIECPVCGSKSVRQAPSAPALLKSGSADKSDAIAVKLRHAMDEVRRTVEENCDYVGDKFPEEARKLHYGERKGRPVYGEATKDEASDLNDEGIEVVSIPWPSRQDS